ncbi:peptidyl-prolyl cis-trans isomerase [Sulfobacillus acidophilus]|uniref:Peptidyl-prolyl cis-trans isomerase n=1 Tax=Sulfobacillus acidophilus TaxID=53633 RepID=A0ABS3AVX7_9FIRM|nr:peptidyl-prolyl cis-trans isomerase [Sulfobacillus acidophilus]
MLRIKYIFFTIFFISTITYADFCEDDGKGKVVDKIVAVVNSEPILLSDIKLYNSKLSKQNSMEPLEAIIADKLVQKECEKLGLSVSDQEVAFAMDNVIKQNSFDKNKFEQALKAQGMSVDEYRNQLKKQLYRMKIIQAEIKNRIFISEQDIKSEYEKRYGKQAQVKKAHLHHILFKNKDKKQLDYALNKINKGANFFDVAKELTNKNNDIIHADLGEVQKGDLLADFEDAIFAGKKGEVVGPIESPNGTHLVLIKDWSLVERTPLEKVEKDLHNFLFEKEIEQVFKQYVNELRIASFVKVYHGLANQ